MKYLRTATKVAFINSDFSEIITNIENKTDLIDRGLSHIRDGLTSEKVSVFSTGFNQSPELEKNFWEWDNEVIKEHDRIEKNKIAIDLSILLTDYAIILR